MDIKHLPIIIRALKTAIMHDRIALSSASDNEHLYNVIAESIKEYDEVLVYLEKIASKIEGFEKGKYVEIN